MTTTLGCHGFSLVRFALSGFVFMCATPSASAASWRWTCELNGGYTVNLADDGRSEGRAAPHGASTPSVIEVESTDAGDYKAIVGGRTVSGKENIAVEILNGHPTQVKIAYVDVSTSVLITIAKADKGSNWRYVDTVMQIMPDTIAKKMEPSATYACRFWGKLHPSNTLIRIRTGTSVALAEGLFP
jgi:hypothetical protein